MSDAAADGGHGLWVTSEGSLFHYQDGWTPMDTGLPPANALWDTDDGLWISTSEALIAADERGMERARWPIPEVTSFLLTPDGGWATSATGGVWRWSGDTLREVYHEQVHGPMIKVLSAEGGVWASSHRELLFLHEDELVARVAVPMSIHGGGDAILRDREGSLWTGSPVGLWQLPSPETWIWSPKDGLTAATHLAAAGDELWVFSWWRPSVIHPAGDVEPASVENFAWPPGDDRNGTLWALGQAADGDFGLYALTDRARLTTKIPAFPFHVALARDGLWLLLGDGLYHASPDGRGLERRSEFLASRVLETSAGELILSRRGEVCRLPVAAVASPPRCTALPALAFAHALLEVDGEVWLGGEGLAVMRLTQDGVEPVPGSEALPTRVVTSLSPSPRGGVWVSSVGAVWRVQPAADSTRPWEVLEVLDAWAGVPPSAGNSVAELPSGVLWTAAAEGAVRVPAHAREVRPLSVAPVAVELRADGQATSPGGAELGWPRNALDLQFAVASYREPDRLWWRHRVRADDPWSAPGRSAHLQLIDLRAGQHNFEVQVSPDGVRWSPPSVPLPIVVTLPWLMRPPALAAAGSLAMAAVYAAHRLRVAAAVRVAQERARIAMDLHDELGSGLGALSVLSGLAAEHDLDELARRDIAAQAAQTAQALGDSLSNIVWTLRRDSGTLASLARALAERGARIFAAGAARFEVDVPANLSADQQLPLPVYRAVHLIGLEALHNAAKHADARHVWLRLSPGRTCHLTVEDDGRGMDAGSEHAGTGAGLASMAARADQIGATLTIAPRPSGGTIVTLSFDATRASLQEPT